MSKARELAKMGEVLTNSQIGSRRNMIINGAMAIFQRGSQASTRTSYAVDRFKADGSGSQQFTYSQSTTVPSGQGFSYSAKLDVTTADTSVAAAEFQVLRYIFEGQDLQHLKYGTSDAESLTLQFWVRSSKTGAHIVELEHTDANYQNSQSYTITTADTWQKVTLTFDGYQTTSITNDNTAGFQINWWLMAGSNFTSGTLSSNTWQNTTANRAVGQVNVADSTSNDWYITGVQLEVGSTATPFEHRSFGEELALCQRYFQKSYNHGDAIGNTSNSNGSNAFQIDDGSIQRDGVRLTQTMRADPTIVIYNPSTGSSASVRTNAAGNHSVSTFSKGQNGFFVDYTPNTGEFLQFHHTADAEL